MFKRSSRCKTDSPLCVEVDGLDNNEVLVVCSRRPNTVVCFTRDEWAAFIDGAKRGEFDLQPVTTRVG